MSYPTQDGLVGQQIGKYEILEEVGFGGMSVVYRAHDGVLDREVAVKVLHPHLSKRPESRQRFRREAKAVAKLKHPNIVEIFDYSADQANQAFIVTEFVRGLTLRELVEKGEVPFPEVGAMIVLQLAEALTHAHELGVLHRDVKPENAMIRSDGVVKLMDFGIAQVRDAQKMTQTGSLLGSPGHMAPEVISGEEPDLRSDIFSLGTVLYYTTTGELPYQGRNAAVILRSIVDGKYLDPEIRDPRIGQRLGNIIRKCLASNPDDRYQHLDDIVSDLRSCLEEVDLADTVSELRQLFVDPEAYAQDLRERLLSGLEKSGQTLLEAKRVARAVDCFNRILAIDDGHEGVRRLLARLDRRRRLAGYGIALGVALALAAVVMAAAGVFSTSGSGESRNRMDRALTSADEGVNAAFEAGVFEGELQFKAAQERTRNAILHAQLGLEGLARTAPYGMMGYLKANALAANARALAETWPEEEEPDDPVEPDQNPEVEPGDADAGVAEAETDAGQDDAPIHVMLQCNQILEIFVDDVYVGDRSVIERHGGIALRPGEHTVRYEHSLIVDGCVQRFTVPDDLIFDPPDVLAPRHVCRWHDGTLLVRSDIAAVVMLDNVQVGEAGTSIGVPIDHPSGRVDATITVYPANGASGTPVEVDARLSAGQETVIRVTLGE